MPDSSPSEVEALESSRRERTLLSASNLSTGRPLARRDTSEQLRIVSIKSHLHASGDAVACRFFRRGSKPASHDFRQRL